MSLTRRLAAGLPAAGVIAFATLAFSGTPALATGDGSQRAGQPVVMATPCDTDAARTDCDASAGSDGYGGGAQADNDDDDIPNDNATGDNNGNNDDTRGNTGYGGESPAPSPSETTPTGTTDTVPPGGGESPGTTSPSTPGGGVSAGGNLPLTGAPMGATIGLGSAMVVAGAAAVWYTRRRRSA
ncbi:hypothetical protein AB0M20_36245, partial [Actinoplanes sp. NPDC051633]